MISIIQQLQQIKVCFILPVIGKLTYGVFWMAKSKPYSNIHTQTKDLLSVQ